MKRALELSGSVPLSTVVWRRWQGEGWGHSLLCKGQLFRLLGHCHDQQLFNFAILVPRLTQWVDHVSQNGCVLLISSIFVYFVYVCVCVSAGHVP